MRVIPIARTVIMNWIPGYIPHEGQVPDADQLAEMAGRLCYLSWDRPNPKTRTIWGYLKNIIKQMHFSVLEHASVTFYIDGVTRNFSHELIRHRHLSFSEVSQRYVDVSTFPFVVHPGLEGVDPSEIQTVTSASKSVYRTVMDWLTGKGKESKAARQAARHVLPGGTETKILVTGNMRAWREVLDKRLSPAADAEFRAVAHRILEELLVIAPNTFADLGEKWGVTNGGSTEAARLGEPVAVG